HRAAGRADVVQAGVRVEAAADGFRRAVDQVLDEIGAEHTHPLAQLARGQQLDQQRRVLGVGQASGDVVQVVDQLVFVRMTTHRVDAADTVLQLDLAHHHLGQVRQQRRFLGAERARPVVDHAQRAEAVARA
ncbi:conserved hypothetical protein, partial [Ricinus communis]